MGSAAVSGCEPENPNCPNDTIGPEEQKWIDWFKEDDNHRASGIPANILNNTQVEKEITKIIKDRLDAALPAGAETYSNDSESYDRSVNNADINNFLNGDEIIFCQPILTLRDGEKTNRLSLEWVKRGKYDRSIRYILRAMIGMYLVKTGSKGEKSDAVYFAKNILNELGTNAYPGADEATLGADAAFIISQDPSTDFYASGVDKSHAYKGRGFTRKNSEKWADQTSDGVKGIIFGGGAIETETAKDIGIKVFPDRVGMEALEFPDKVDSYSQLNNSGKRRIDAMAEFTRTLLKEKTNAVINGFDGSDQGLLVDAFRLYKQIWDSGGDDAAQEMLGMSPGNSEKNIQKARECAETLYWEYAGNSNLSYYMKEPLSVAIAEFVGIPEGSRRRFRETGSAASSSAD